MKLFFKKCIVYTLMTMLGLSTWIGSGLINTQSAKAAADPVYVTTIAADPVDQTAATLNGANGDTAADNTSFWWGPSSASPFTAAVNPADQLPSDWSHAPLGTGAQIAGASFSDALTGFTPNTEYHFVAWSEVSGTWYPGEVLPFVTAPVGQVYIDADADNTLDAGELTFATIQAAIDAASAGNTVIVGAGTYNEQVIIDKAVSVLGAGAATTFIDGIGVTPVLPGLVNITNEIGAVTLDGFTIRNAPASGGTRITIWAKQADEGSVYSSSMTITHNILVGNGHLVSTDDYGLYSKYNKSNLVFSYNDVSNFGGNVFLFELHTGPAEISHNTITVDPGCGSTAFFSMSYKDGYANNNDVTGKQWLHDNTINANGESAITMASAVGFGGYNDNTYGKYTNVEIADNVISNVGDAKKGIQLEVDGDNGGFVNPLITGNAISAKDPNPGPGLSRGIRIMGVVTGAQILDNIITSFYRGIYQSDSFSHLVYPTNTQISTNVITGGAYGVDIAGGTATIHLNSIVGNTLFGVNNQAVATIDATNNWWGNDDGPGWNSQTNGSVDYSPFCLDSSCATFGTGTNPVSNAGSDQIKNAVFTQTGTATDSGSGVASTTWAKTSGSGNITFGDASTLTTTISADAAGTYEIQLTVIDNAGNSSSDTMTLIWDTIAPSASVVVQIPTSTNNSTPQVTVNVENGVGFKIKNGATELVSNTGTGANQVITLPSLVDGTYNLTLVATDAASNQTSVALNQFIVDTIAPTIPSYTVSETKISPNNDGTKDSSNIDVAYSEQVNADINILDDHGVKVRDLYSASDVTNPDAHDWNGKNNSSVVVADGVYTIQVIGTDSAGLTVTDISKTITVDNTAPVIALNGITQDIEIGGSYAELGATAVDAVDGSFAATPSGSVNATLFGTYTITYNATDSVGNHATSVTRTVNVVDTTPPVISSAWITPNPATTGDEVVIKATVTDNRGIASVRISINGGTYNLMDNTGDYQFGYTVPLNSLNTINYTVRATDATGLITTRSGTIDPSDNDAPTITAITGNTSGTTGELVPILITATDNIGFGHATITFSSGTHDMTTSGSSFSYNIPVPTGSTASIGYFVTVYDATSNQTSSPTYNIVVTDNDAPVIAAHGNIGSIKATSPAGAVVTYTAPSTTDNIDTTALATCSPASGSTFAIGTTTVNCDKTDAAGNHAIPTTFNVVVTADVVPEDFGVMQISGVNGYTVGFGLIGITAADIASVKVELFNGSTLLSTSNGVAPAINSLGSTTSLSSPFNINGPFNYAADGYWTNTGWNGSLADIPTKAVISVTDLIGNTYKAENTNLTGNPLPYVAAQDFGVMQLSEVNGYTVGFGFVNDMNSGDVTSIKVDLYENDTLLGETNATGNVFALNATDLSSPFDVNGTFNYVADGFWNYSGWLKSAGNVPTKAVITVIDSLGCTYTVTNSNLSGDPTLLLPAIPAKPAISVTAGDGKSINVDFKGVDGGVVEYKVFVNGIPAKTIAVVGNDFGIDYHVNVPVNSYGTYSVYVVARNSSNEVSQSITGSFALVALASATVTAPTFTATAIDKDGAKYLDISWKGTGADFYKIMVNGSEIDTITGASNDLGLPYNWTRKVSKGIKYTVTMIAVKNEVESINNISTTVDVPAAVVVPQPTVISTHARVVSFPAPTTAVTPAKVQAAVPEAKVETPKDDAAGIVKGEDTNTAGDTNNWTPWIILFILILLAGAATGGYFYWFSDKSGAEVKVKTKVKGKTIEPVKVVEKQEQTVKQVVQPEKKAQVAKPVQVANKKNHKKTKRW